MQRIVARKMAYSSAASGVDMVKGEGGQNLGINIPLFFVPTIDWRGWGPRGVGLPFLRRLPSGKIKSSKVSNNLRRDKEFCHECRFCCTLSVCTDETGTSFKDSELELNKSVSGMRGRRMITARMGYQVDMKMYKTNDYRCLKPIGGRPSVEWPHYDMASHRAAKTETELEQAEIIPFDINFFNMEDPRVFKAFTNPKTGVKLWKKTYGFDYVTFSQGLGGKSNASECHQHCLKAEFGKFARQCKRSGGLFKCCILG